MSKRVIKQNIRVTNIERKLGQLVKLKFIRKKTGMVDYPNMHNVKVIYYYRGNPDTYIPQPKAVL